MLFLLLNNSSTKRLYGDWVSESGGKISFHDSGEFYQGRNKVGNFKVLDDKTIEFTFDDFNLWFETYSYEWSPEAKDMDNKNCWYIEGNNLYIFGKKYSK